jgi:glycosyltransferase involved in cell wall biosynthesis
MILFVAARKGAYWRALHLAKNLVRRGHQVTLLAMSPGRHLRFQVTNEAGVIIVEAPDLLWGSLRSGWDPVEVLRRILWLRGRSIDLIHIFDCRPTAIFPALYLKSKLRIPLIIDWEDWLGKGGSVSERPNPLIRAFLQPVETYFEERFRTRADGTTVICNTLREKAIALGVPPESILLLRDGSDLEGIQPLDRDTCRRELGISTDCHIIGYLGSIFLRDAQLMAQAFDRIHESMPSALLLLIGYVTYPVEKMVTATEAVISTRVVCHADLNRYLAACDLCWLPFHDSGANRGRWPMKLNDYMSAGRPTIATAVGDVTSVMTRHEIGILSPDAPDALAEKALSLLADPKLCIALGKNARRVAEEHFNWQTRVAELESFYKKVLIRCPNPSVWG